MSLISFWDQVENELSDRLLCDFRIAIDFEGINSLETLKCSECCEAIEELKWLLIERWLLSWEVGFNAWREHLDPDLEVNQWLLDVEDSDKFWLLMEGIESGL